MTSPEPQPAEPDQHALEIDSRFSSMDEPLSSKNGVEVRKVSKRFSLNTEPISRVSSLFFNRFISGVRKRDFWALRDVSFDIPKGEMLGILGVNGSGKSTMLKLICGISDASSGVIRRLPRIAPLLDIAGGFHPALSGYENIFLNGSIIGLHRDQIRELLPGIIEFSGLEHKFLEAPVRTYSAGMKARLGFALAVAVDPDIILIDEVLAVGDLDFQRRSAQKLLEFRDQGKAMVLVSHSALVIRELSTKAIWLHEGVVKAAGDAPDIVPLYSRYLTEQVRRQGRKEGVAAMETRMAIVPNLVTFDAAILTDEHGKETATFKTKGHLTLTFEFHSKEATPPTDLHVALQYQNGAVVEEFMASHRGFQPVAAGPAPCRVNITFDPLNLLGGDYILEVMAFEAGEPEAIFGYSSPITFAVESDFPSFDVYPSFVPVEFTIR